MKYRTIQAIGAVLALAFLLLVGSSSSQEKQKTRRPKLTDFQVLHGIPRGPLGSNVSILVEPGTKDSAVKYYLRIEAPDELELNLVDETGKPEATLDSILVYLGYRDAADEKGLTADRVERFESDDLVDFAALKKAVVTDGGAEGSVKAFAAGDVLATRYFSPKITDVAREPQFFQYGWRKLVQLKALAGSLAAKKGVASGYVLFNVFADEAQLFAATPFKKVNGEPNRSQQNQVILVRNSEGNNELDNPIYWIVFGPLPDGTLGFALNASFDFRSPDAVPPGKAYFVPSACADCHGGLDPRTKEPLFGQAKLNYLDTDHWFDRVTGVPGKLTDDFQAIGKTKHGILFDAGKDPTTDQFRTAFARIVDVNKAIRAQNKQVDQAESTFQFRSVSKWLAIHEANVKHVGILDDLDQDGFLDRAIEGDAGSIGAKDLWRKNDRLDEALLPVLNRYCYRCHSSVKYSIYDRSRVRTLSRDGDRGIMQFYLTQAVPPEGVPFMPQDRPMLPGDRRQVVDLLNRLIDSER